MYLRRRIVAGGAAVALVGGIVAGTAVGVGALTAGSSVGTSPVGARTETATHQISALPIPAQRGDGDADQPVPEQSEPAPEAGGPCADPDVQRALADGTDADVVTAVGGGEAFRAAVAAGGASCLDLGEPHRTWVVVNKLNPLDPLDYWPEPQARAEGVERTSGGHMRADVAAALSELVAAAEEEGAGSIGVNSGFRSYDMQVSTYQGYVGELGREQADLTSARPGYSEHQTGLAVDVVACDPACGGIDDFGGTPQSDWVADNAARFGFIVRYGDGHTDTTGYEYEPWHLRFVGVDLASAYADGGYRTLEEFFGLPAAANYDD